MKTVVVYQSKTGFTKKYAEWIAEALSCDLRAGSDVTAAEVARYDLVIYGGWIMGGTINGLDRIRSDQPRNLIVFGVGFTSPTELEIGKMAELNKLTATPLFYFEGGMCPEKMGFMGRTMVKLATKKTPVYTDHTNRENIAGLVKCARDLGAH